MMVSCIDVARKENSMLIIIQMLFIFYLIYKSHVCIVLVTTPQIDYYRAGKDAEKDNLND